MAAGAVALTLLSLAVGMTISEHRQQLQEERVEMQREAEEHAQLLNHYFARARSLTKLLARNEAFAHFYDLPGSRLQRVTSGDPAVRESNQALAYMAHLFPGSIGEACFIDHGGAENARAVKGEIAPIADLSTEEGSAPFFAPTFALRPGRVYQARPYVSPDTGEWVVSNSTPVALPGAKGRAIVHFEVTVESFRQQAAEHGSNYTVAVIDAHSGERIIDSAFPQPADPEAPLGPGDSDGFEGIAASAAEEGETEVNSRIAAFAHLDRSVHNANDWIVVATATSPAASWLNSLGALQVGIIGGAALLLVLGLLAFASSQRALHAAALTDPLTGLGNRRKLMRDLQGRLGATRPRPTVLAIYDLDGFKDYNDAFGHPAGDSLLVRLAQALPGALDGTGEGYRIGGDEFCVLIDGIEAEAALKRAQVALSEEGEGFVVGASRGAVTLPKETAETAEALRIADQRMYANKNTGRSSAGRQATDALVSVLSERHPDLGQHLGHVESLCERVADGLDLPPDERTAMMQAASLHDVGKIAVPDSVLNKPSTLNEEEWRFVRQHTLIGERILASAPALARAGKLVRWSHERWDGKGYPDRIAGEEIPLGARIITVCDAYDAMTSERPYAGAMSHAEAVTELRGCAGSHFDPQVVEAFVAAFKEGHSPPQAPAPIAR